MKIERKVMVDRNSVRQACIKNEWYTFGNNDQYENLLFNIIPSAVAPLTDERLNEIVEDIAIRSDLQGFKEQTGEDAKAFLEHIAYTIVNDCCFTRIEVIKQ